MPTIFNKLLKNIKNETKKEETPVVRVTKHSNSTKIDTKDLNK